MEEDLISIIIPVYNVEKYIRYCLDSVINQTYKNLEIIVVDDGSTDSSSTICDEYAKKDSRIRVIHKVNGGLSDARNVALKEISGKYIAFVDSDDVISTDFYTYLHNLIKTEDYDIAECNFLRIDSEKIMDIQKILDEKNNELGNNIVLNVQSNLDALKLLYGRYLLPYVNKVVVWNKLYKKELFENIEYPVGRYHEDEFTSYKIFNRITKMVSSNKYLHGYMQTQNSIMRRSIKQKQIDDNLDAYSSCIEYFSNNKYVQAKCMRRYLENCFELYYKVEKGSDDSTEKENKYRYLINLFKNKYVEYIDIINEYTIDFDELEIVNVIKDAYNESLNNDNINLKDYYAIIDKMVR